MANRMTKEAAKKKKKPGIGWIIVIIWVLASLLESLDEIEIRFPNLSRLILRTGLTEEQLMMAGAVLLVVISAVIVFSKSEKKKAAGGGPVYKGKEAMKMKPEKGVHSHDRLTTNVSEQHFTGGTHWKQQLDGFLAAGLIDRAEYKVLWEKYGNQE